MLSLHSAGWGVVWKIQHEFTQGGKYLGSPPTTHNFNVTLLSSFNLYSKASYLYGKCVPHLIGNKTNSSYDLPEIVGGHHSEVRGKFCILTIKGRQGNLAAMKASSTSPSYVFKRICICYNS